MLHTVAGLTEGNWNTLIQWVVGPVALLVIGWLLDRRSKRRQKTTDAKVEQIPQIVSSALKKTAEQLGAQVADTKDAVTNNHDKHIRDDLDEQFGQLNTLLEEVLEQLQDAFGRIKVIEARGLRHGKLLTTMGKALARVTRDITGLIDRDAELELGAEEMLQRVQDIEDTIPRDQIRKLARQALQKSHPTATGPPPAEADELDEELRLLGDDTGRVQ